MNLAEEIAHTLVILELAEVMRKAHEACSKLARFPEEMLAKRRDDNGPQIDMMLAVIAKAKEMRDVLEATKAMEDAMVQRAKAVAETGKAAVPA